VQSKELVLGAKLRRLIEELKTQAQAANMKLHFVTARQAYNIVKAAESGRNGDPEQYRDFAVAPPVNSRIHVTREMSALVVSDRRIAFAPRERGFAEYELNGAPITKIVGDVARFELDLGATDVAVATVYGAGTIELTTTTGAVTTANRISETRSVGANEILVLEALPP